MEQLEASRAMHSNGPSQLRKPFRKRVLLVLVVQAVIGALLIYFCLAGDTGLLLHKGRHVLFPQPRTDLDLSLATWETRSEQHTFPLLKRGVYEDNESRGCKLVQLMNTPDAQLEAPYKALWSNYDDIEKYGWSQDKEEGVINEDEIDHSLSVLKELGFPAGLKDDPSFIKVAWTHDREVTVDGKTYPVGLPVISRFPSNKVS